MESADPFNLTFVLYKCIIDHQFMIFNRKNHNQMVFVRMHKMIETNLYDSIALADRIKLQCKSRNVQIKDVMDSANLSNGTLYNLRSGKMLKADSLARIADALDCSMDFLMGRTVDPAVKRMDLTDDERQKVTDYLQFILSQRK